MTLRPPDTPVFLDRLTDGFDYAVVGPTDGRRPVRDTRAALVARVSRKTGQSHREVHARINRATGASNVASATREQLEKGNALLEKQLDR